VRIIETDSKRVDHSTFKVVMEADTQDALTTPMSKKAAMAYAADHNFPAFGLAPECRPYPVDKNGILSNDLLHNRADICAWRCEYVIRARLGGM